jgi:hypothetical protein
VNPNQATSARVYDYLLAGKDNFPVDRAVADVAWSVFPGLREAAWENRAFMGRATASLARAGFRQFLDVGTGFPARPDLHEVAQHIIPEATVVYVDKDAQVLVHARALLRSRPPGCTAFVEADLRDPAKILASPAMALFDADEPVALNLVGILPFLSDAPDPYGIVAELLAGLPAGSALVLSHLTAEYAPEPVGRLVDVYTAAGIPVQARSWAEVARFFTGLDLVEPGLVSCQRWHRTAPDVGTLSDPPTDAAVSCYGAVGRA